MVKFKVKNLSNELWNKSQPLVNSVSEKVSGAVIEVKDQLTVAATEVQGHLTEVQGQLADAVSEAKDHFTNWMHRKR